jgi:hypothetical protein
MMDWLGETLRAKDPDGKKALLILTHHQYISAFKGETEYTKPAIQLAEKIGKDRSVVWLWGHEHKFSLYAKAQVEEGVKAYGRCIGHGGMPVELKGFVMEEGKHGYNKLVMVDRRPIPGTDAYPLGYNGYAMLNLEGPTLGIEYYDIKGFLFAEHWKPDGKGGVSGNITKPATDIRIETYDNRPWEDAVD